MSNPTKQKRFDFWLWRAVFLYVANLTGWAVFFVRKSIYG